jgi:hypothetical protein
MTPETVAVEPSIRARLTRGPRSGKLEHLRSFIHLHDDDFPGFEYNLLR